MSTMSNMPADMPAIRATAMPSDTNPEGDIFGGWLMSQMDLAAGSCATKIARGRTVTVAMDGMIFHTPVFVGDEVSFYAKLVSTGRTSMKIFVEAWRRPRDGHQGCKVTEATFTFVAIGSDRRPRPVYNDRPYLPGVDDVVAPVPVNDIPGPPRLG